MFQIASSLRLHFSINQLNWEFRNDTPAADCGFCWFLCNYFKKI